MTRSLPEVEMARPGPRAVRAEVVRADVVRTGVVRAQMVRADGARADEAPDRDLAVDLLFRRHYEGLLRLAHCLTGEQDAAEDVVQEAFASLHRHWGQLSAPDAAHAYLRAAVVNRCHSRIRDLVRDRLPRVWRPEPTAVPSAEDHAVKGDEADRLARAVHRLPGRQRQVVVCRYYLELSERETAELLGIGTGSVKRHAHRAVAALATELKAER